MYHSAGKTLSHAWQVYKKKRARWITLSEKLLILFSSLQKKAIQSSFPLRQ